MKTRFSFALLLLVLGMATGHGQDQSKQDSDNGYWWVNQSETFKLGFADGYAEALTIASDRTFLMCPAEMNGGAIPKKIPADDELKACSANPTETLFDFSGIRVGQLVEGVFPPLAPHRRSE
jgi:hypothetical protein